MANPINMLIPGAGFIISHPKAGEAIPVSPFIPQCSFHTDNFGVAIKGVGMFQEAMGVVAGIFLLGSGLFPFH